MFVGGSNLHVCMWGGAIFMCVSGEQYSCVCWWGGGRDIHTLVIGFNDMGDVFIVLYLTRPLQLLLITFFCVIF